MSRWRAPLLLPVPSLEADDEEDVVERAKENRVCGPDPDPDPGIGDVGALILMAVSWDATEFERVAVFGPCSCAGAGVSDCEGPFNLFRLNFPERVDGLRAVRPPDGRSNGRC